MASPQTIPQLSNTWTPENIPSDAYLESGSASQAVGSGSAKMLAFYALPPGINVKAFGAKGDGSTTDTAAIQAGLDYATAHARELFFPAGTYKTGTLTVPNGGQCRINGEGPALSILSFSAVTEGISVAHVDKVSIRNLGFAGTTSRAIALKGSGTNVGVLIQNCDISGATIHPGSLNVAAIYIDGFDDVSILNCKTHDNGAATTPKGAEVCINNGVGGATFNKRLLIEGNSFLCSGTAFGVLVFNTNQARISNNDVDGAILDVADASGYGIAVYSNGTNMFGHTIIGNRVNNTQGTGIYVNQCDDTTVVGNSLQNVCQSQTLASITLGGIAVNTCVRVNVANNVINDSNVYGIDLNATQSSVTGNTVIAATNTGIFLRGTNKGNVVQANTIKGAGQHGILATSASNNVSVVGNVVDGMTSEAISFSNGTSIAMIGNVSTGCANGLFILAGANNTVVGNTCTGNGGAGTGLNIESTKTIVACNYVSAFTYGVDLEGAQMVASLNFLLGNTNTAYVSVGTITNIITSGTQPSVGGADNFFLTFASGVDVVDFLDGFPGDTKTFVATNGNATIHSNGSINLQGGIDWTMASGDTLTLKRVATGTTSAVWYEIGRKT